MGGGAGDELKTIVCWDCSCRIIRLAGNSSELLLSKWCPSDDVTDPLSQIISQGADHCWCPLTWQATLRDSQQIATHNTRRLWAQTRDSTDQYQACTGLSLWHWLMSAPWGRSTWSGPPGGITSVHVTSVVTTEASRRQRVASAGTSGHYVVIQGRPPLTQPGRLCQPPVPGSGSGSETLAHCVHSCSHNYKQ